MKTTLETSDLNRFKRALGEKLAGGEFRLPPLPHIAQQVVNMASSSDSDAQKLGELVHRDQALAAHVIRMANSPLYMPKVPIESLDQAVSRLGFRILSEIAFAAAVNGSTFSAPGYEPVVRYLWRHSLASGAYAKEIAKVRQREQGGIFLCGLLHAIGKPILLQTVVQLQKEFSLHLTVGGAKKLVEQYHIQVGKLVAKKWGLPAPVSESIAYYQRYTEAPGYPDDAGTTCMADRFATHFMNPKAFTPESFYDHPVFEDLDVRPELGDQIRAREDDIRELVQAMDC